MKTKKKKRVRKRVMEMEKINIEPGVEVHLLVRVITFKNGSTVFDVIEPFDDMQKAKQKAIMLDSGLKDIMGHLIVHPQQQSEMGLQMGIFLATLGIQGISHGVRTQKIKGLIDTAQPSKIILPS